MKPKHIYILLAIMALAAFFRFYLIREMPGGLFPDEAANGLDINLMEQGILQPFYERGNGREALFFYMLWGSVLAFGRGAWQHHIVSALVGTLSVLGCFLVTRTLFSMTFQKRIELIPSNMARMQNVLSSPILGAKHDDLQSVEQRRKLLDLAGSVWESRAIILALIASFIMAVSTWHIVLSRTAFRANLIPLIATFMFYFGLKIFYEREEGRKFRWAIWFGIFFALGFYTYIAYRILVPVVAVLCFWPIIADLLVKPRLSALRRYISKGFVALLFFLIAFAPLGYYFYSHPGSFVGRSGQVSVFNPELNGGDLVGTILEVTRLSFLGYFTEGDLNWRHNISGLPFLAPVISPFFGLGLVLVTLFAIRYFFRPVKYASDFKHFLLAGWFYGMLLPVITTAEGIPHGLRAIGTIPTVFIITAYGLYAVGSGLYRWAQSWTGMLGAVQAKLISALVWMVGGALAIVLVLTSYKAYFVTAYNDPNNFYAFRSDLTQVVEYLKKEGEKQTTYLVLDKFSMQTIDYLTTVDGRHPGNPKNQPYTQVDPEDSWKSIEEVKDGRPIWPFGLKKGDEIVFTQSSVYDIKKFKQYHPNTKLVKEVRNKFGQAVMAVYEVQ